MTLFLLFFCPVVLNKMLKTDKIDLGYRYAINPKLLISFLFDHSFSPFIFMCYHHIHNQSYAYALFH